MIQRVQRASVAVDGQTVGSIGPGLLLLLGVAAGDGPAEIEAMAHKVAHLRIFPDDSGRMNRSVADAGGGVLVVSQFTLLADVRRGRRPSFARAADPSEAEPLIDAFVDALAERGIPTATGEFGAMMEVDLINDGPVTIVIDVEDGSVR